MTTFNTMWQTVVDAYASSPLVFFDIMNEPWAESPTAFIDLAVQWMATFPTVPKNQVVVAGNYNDNDVNQQGADPRLDGCLLSLHFYPSGTSLSPQYWGSQMMTHVGPYSSRTIVSEWSVTMTGGADYTADGGIGTNVDIAYMQGVTDEMRTQGIGSCLWTGLRNGNEYSITSLSGTGTNLSLTVVNASALAQIQWGWGL
jgi:hypothetical protein